MGQSTIPREDPCIHEDGGTVNYEFEKARIENTSPTLEANYPWSLK